MYIHTYIHTSAHAYAFCVCVCVCVCVLSLRGRKVSSRPNILYNVIMLSYMHTGRAVVTHAIKIAYTCIHTDVRTYIHTQT